MAVTRTAMLPPGFMMVYFGVDELTILGCTSIAPTIAYTVFYHDLLISELHHISYEKYTDGIHIPKYLPDGFQRIYLSQ